MSLEKDITAIKSLLEQETPLFKAASPEQRRYRREAETGRIRARYNSLPYTYDDIIKLPVYEKIIDLKGVTDTTTDEMKFHRTTSFMVVAGEDSRGNDNKNEYRVYANGILRTGTRFKYRASVLKRYPPAMTLDAYSELMDRLYATIVRFIDKYSREIIYYVYDITDSNYNRIEKVYYKRNVDPEYVKQSLVSDGYNPNIYVFRKGVKRGEKVREKVG